MGAHREQGDCLVPMRLCDTAHPSGNGVVVKADGGLALGKSGSWQTQEHAGIRGRGSTTVDDTPGRGRPPRQLHGGGGKMCV